MVEQRLVSEFKRPKKVDFSVDSESHFIGRFSAKPYERGFGTTIGNSLRRVLLSSVPGYAIIAIKIDGINNELQNIKGVYQDTTEIIANFKNVAVRIDDPNVKSKVVHYEIAGKTTFTAGDLAKDSTVKIGNPDLVLFTANKDAKFSFDLQIEWGRGYIFSSEFEKQIEMEDVIAIDADFSPVKRVLLSTESVRIGSRSDYEKLIIEIETNGSLEPKAALEEAAQILKESYFTYNSIEIEEPVTSAFEEEGSGEDEKDKVFSKSIYCLGLTIRTYFFLKQCEIREVGQLVIRNEEDLLSKEGCSDMILDDIKEKLALKELSFGMKNIDYSPKVMM